MKQISKISLMLICGLTLSCSIFTNNLNQSIGQLGKNSELKMAKPIPNPYYGDVNIEIDTSLVNNIKESRKFKLEEDKNSFSIQSFNNKDSIFSKSLKIENTEKEVKYNFTITDKSKKYVLFVYKERKNDKLEVKINNISQINSLDFSNDNDVSKPILFDENNEISIKYSGNKNDSIFVSIVESSKIENIRKKISAIKWREITKNSSNITLFNPNDLSSLGNLTPYEGDIKGNDNKFISLANIENTIAKFDAGIVVVQLKEPIQQNLQTLLQNLNTDKYVLDNYDGNYIATIKINYDSVNLSNFLSNLKELNTFSSAPIKDISFSSINSAKTVATFIDILVNYSNLVLNASISNILAQNGAYSGEEDINGNIITQEEQRIFANPKTHSNTNYDDTASFANEIQMNLPKKSTDFWHLTDSNITKAWKYSVGENINFGIFDTDFSKSIIGNVGTNGDTTIHNGNAKKDLTYILNINNDLSVNSLDFKKRVESFSCPLFGYYNIKNSNEPISSYNCQYSFQESGHGFKIASIMASDMNDNRGIAGISPKSKLSLFTYEENNSLGYSLVGLGSLSNLLRALENHKDYISNNIDVINMSSGGILSKLDQQSTRNSSYCLPMENSLGIIPDSYICNPVSFNSILLISKLSNTKKTLDGRTNPNYNPNKKSIIFVSAIGNDNKEVSASKNKFYFPSSLANVIGVGGYELSNLYNGDRIRGDFYPKNGNLGEKSSNYGDVDIWAPGDNIPIFIPNLNLWEVAVGTSFASPIIASSLGLAKSINPNLDVFEARKLLQETGQVLTHPSFNANPNYPPKALDAEALVKKVLSETKQIEATSLNVSGYPTTKILEYHDYIEIQGKNFLNPNLKLEFENTRTHEIYSLDVPDRYMTNNGTKILFEFVPERFIKTTDSTKNLKTDTDQKASGYIKDTYKAYIGNSVNRVQIGSSEYNIFGTNLWELRMYNVDDTSYAYVNFNGNYQKTTYFGDTTIDITDRINEFSDNRFDLKTYNYSGGYTWGFDIIKNKTVVFSEKAGTSGVEGANGNDQSKTNRYVFDKTLLFTDRIRNSSEITIINNLDSQIAFESYRADPNRENQDIYLMNENGTNQRRLTNIPNSYNYDPLWSPDKKTIMFTSYNYDTGHYYVYTINSDGSNLKKLTEDTSDSYHGAWSYNGKKIIYVSETSGNADIWSMDIDGSNKKNLTNNSFDDVGASIAPGGNKIVFYSNRTGNNDIFVMNLDGSNVVNITNSPADDYEPQWSPDGTKILYTSDQSSIGSGIYNIWTSQADGIDKIKRSNGNEYGAKWSPDGTKIACNRLYSNTRVNIKLIDLATNVTNTINTNSFIDIFSDWLNDSSAVLFSTSRNGNFDVYSMYLDGTHVTQLTSDPADDTNANTYNPRQTFSILGGKFKKHPSKIRNHH
ncbi:MAG: S8 family serine peptidase [Candidatus Sericytochromatia bacterium]